MESGSTEPLDHCSQKPMCSLLIVITDGHYTYLNRSHRNTRFRLSRMSVLMKFSVERSSSDHQPCAVVVVRREDGAFQAGSTNCDAFYDHQTCPQKLPRHRESAGEKSRLVNCARIAAEIELIYRFVRCMTTSTEFRVLG